MALHLTSLAGAGILFLLLLPGAKCLGGAQKECGRSDDRAASPDKRIVGGTKADESRFPWQVRVRSLVATVCGGVLIDSFWVLTAATCFTRNYNPVNWNIGLAEVRVEDDSISDGQQERAKMQAVYVDSLYIYGGHRLDSSRHDIALVHLYSDNFTRQREPACVIAETDDVNNKTCFIVGWGSSRVGEAPSPTLRKLLTPVSDHTHCNQRHNTSVGPDSLCAELPADTRLRGPCTGDTGAPLICKFGDVWKVSGIVSSLFGCDRQGTNPAILVNVQYYAPFISKLINVTSGPVSTAFRRSAHNGLESRRLDNRWQLDMSELLCKWRQDMNYKAEVYMTMEYPHTHCNMTHIHLPCIHTTHITHIHHARRAPSRWG